MIIIAGAIIISLSNSNIISQARTAVNKTNMKEIQEIASLKHMQLYTENKATGTEVTRAEVISEMLKDGIKLEDIL